MSVSSERSPEKTHTPKGVPRLVAVDSAHYTDLGNARRLVQLHGEHLRYVYGVGWHVWNGAHWDEDPGRVALQTRVNSTLASMYIEAGQSQSGSRSELGKWAVTSESATRINALMQLAARDEAIQESPDDLDPDNWLMGTSSGTLDLRTGEVHDPTPAELISRVTSVPYDPEATCPQWEKFLARVQPDEEMRAFIQRAVGYSLTGSVREQVMFVAYGEGDNGKSVLIETLGSLMGTYGQKAPPELLMAKQAETSNDVARLRGARFVAVVETEKGRRLAEARVKELTGADTVAARFLHREFFTFRPVCKLWLVTNHRPRVMGTDNGIWRRLVLLPFREAIPASEKDRDLVDKLRTELPGILAWAVRGCLEWQRQGLATPASVLKAHREYRAEQDVLGGYLSERCVMREDVWTTAADLYSDYTNWCQTNGHALCSQTAFGISLTERGYSRVKKGTFRWMGIALRAPGDYDEEPEDDGPDDTPPAPPTPPPTLMDPDPGPTPPEPRPAGEADPPLTSSPVTSAPAQPSAEVVTRRLRRPWTPKATVYLTWSTGRGVAEDGSSFTVPARSPIAQLLPALPASVQRVVLVGAMPGGSGPGLVSWATAETPDGWSAGSHFLDPDALAARFTRHDGSGVDVHRLAAWSRSGGSARPEQAAQAFELFRAGLVAEFGPVRAKPGEHVDEDPALLPVVLGSPASTGRELLLRSLPSGHEYPVLDREHLELIHHTTGQGRNELLARPEVELPSLYGYDMRWSYAALCRGIIGSGPARLDEVSEFAGYAPGRYEVTFTIPTDWNHVGLLPVHGEGFPSLPGTTWRTWADARELRMAHKWGWRIEDMTIHRRLLYTVDPAKSAPLRTWADKLVDLREKWIPAQAAPDAVADLARDFTRTTLLAGIGAMWGRRQRVTHSVHRDRAGEVPPGAEAYLAGDMLVWTSETEASWREMVHPEWVSQVWAEQRCRLLDTGASGRQPNAGALHLPYSDLVALRTDALYSVTDPGWSDPGTVGAFRRQTAVPGPVPTPRSVEDLLALREA